MDKFTREKSHGRVTAFCSEAVISTILETRSCQRLYLLECFKSQRTEKPAQTSLFHEVDFLSQVNCSVQQGPGCISLSFSCLCLLGVHLIGEGSLLKPLQTSHLHDSPQQMNEPWFPVTLLRLRRLLKNHSSPISNISLVSHWTEVGLLLISELITACQQ